PSKSYPHGNSMFTSSRSHLITTLFAILTAAFAGGCAPVDVEEETGATEQHNSRSTIERDKEWQNERLADFKKYFEGAKLSTGELERDFGEEGTAPIESRSRKDDASCWFELTPNRQNRYVPSGDKYRLAAKEIEPTEFGLPTETFTFPLTNYFE